MYRKVLLCLVVSVAAAALADPQPHRIAGQVPTSACLNCHLNMPRAVSGDTRFLLPRLEGLRRPVTELCAPCHDTDMGHAVGVRVDFPVPADLPLAPERRLTCLTCHYTHGPLESDRPWASVSPLDRIFDPERLHKTFLLRRRNSEGELCLICHPAEES